MTGKKRAPLTTELAVGPANARRRRAETIAGNDEVHPLAHLPPPALHAALHELHVHQIELEMQNEELRHSERLLAAERERYRDLYELAPVAYCTFREDGLILTANLAAASLLAIPRAALVQQPFSRFILPADQDIYYLYDRLLRKAAIAQTCNLHLVRQDGIAFPAQLTATRALGPDGVSVRRIVIKDLTESVRAQTELTKSRDEAHALAARLDEVAETERRRIAVELHDVVSRNLAVVAIHLQTLTLRADPESADQRPPGLAQAQRLLAETADHVRSLMEELRPGVLEDFGLVSAIRACVEHFRALAPLVSVDEHYHEGKSRLPPAVEQRLFRIAQEALHNIACHAAARRVRIAVDLAANPMRISIADDGVGFDTSHWREWDTRPSWGLVYMKERAKTIGATLQIESSPGHGTCVTVELPSPCP